SEENLGVGKAQITDHSLRRLAGHEERDTILIDEIATGRPNFQRIDHRRTDCARRRQQRDRSGEQSHESARFDPHLYRRPKLDAVQRNMDARRRALNTRGWFLWSKGLDVRARTVKYFARDAQPAAHPELALP